MRWKPDNLLKMAQEHETKGEDRMAQNTLRLSREKRELQNIVSNWEGYCEDMKKANHKPLEYASGVVSSTRHGDGEFPVYGFYDENNELVRIEISFTG